MDYMNNGNGNGNGAANRGVTNPMEFADCHRNVTVVMENRFEIPNGKERGEEPLKLFSKWSHVKVALIDANRNSLSYRIYPREMGLIRRRTDAVIANSTLHPATANENSSSPAFFKLFGKKYAGMTAVAALKKFGKQDLLAQREYLFRNLNGQYAENNRRQIAAIDAAVSMAANGSLQENSGEVLIFDSNLRGRSEKVMRFVITYVPGSSMPFVLSLWRWDNVPIVQRPNGAKTFNMKGMRPSKQVSVSISEMEWADLVDSIMDQIHLHKMLTYPTAFSQAVSMQNTIDEAWRSRQTSQPQAQPIPSQPSQQSYNSYESYEPYESYNDEWM